MTLYLPKFSSLITSFCLSPEVTTPLNFVLSIFCCMYHYIWFPPKPRWARSFCVSFLCSLYSLRTCHFPTQRTLREQKLSLKEESVRFMKGNFESLISILCGHRMLQKLKKHRWGPREPERQYFREWVSKTMISMMECWKMVKLCNEASLSLNLSLLFPLGAGCPRGVNWPLSTSISSVGKRVCFSPESCEDLAFSKPSIKY